jgi:hypothetical protein
MRGSLRWTQHGNLNNGLKAYDKKHSGHMQALHFYIFRGVIFRIGGVIHIFGIFKTKKILFRLLSAPREASFSQHWHTVQIQCMHICSAVQ